MGSKGRPCSHGALEVMRSSAGGKGGAMEPWSRTPFRTMGGKSGASGASGGGGSPWGHRKGPIGRVYVGVGVGVGVRRVRPWGPCGHEKGSTGGKSGASGASGASGGGGSPWGHEKRSAGSAGMVP